MTEWNEKYIVLSSRSTSRPGPFRVSHTPYSRELIDAFADPEVESITGQWAAQVGKTEAVKAMLAYSIKEDPGPALWVAPSVDMAKSFSETRFDPMIEDNKILREQRFAEPKKYKLLEKHFKGMSLHFTGASSPANLASRPIRNLFMDEVDKYPLATEREAAAADLAIQRTATYFNRTIVAISTPTLKSGSIHKRFSMGDQRYYLVPCLACGKFQKLEMANLRVPEESRESDGEPVRDKILEQTRYHCPHCDHAHDERDKPTMLLRGHWQPTAISKKHRSYQLSRLYSPFTPWGECLAEFLFAKDDVMALKNVVQNLLGEPWEEPGMTVDEALVMSHRVDYAEVIPEDIFCLFITADVQHDRVYFVVRAFGRHATSWLVRYGVVERLDDLATVCNMAVRGKNGSMQVDPRNVWVDSGDRADEVYKVCRKHGWTPIKGADANIRPWEYPVQKSKTTANLHNIDTQRFKHDLVRLLTNPPGGPGSWNLPSNVTLAYARHLAAEKAVRKRDKFGRDVMEWHVSGANHWWDCEVYQLAAAFWRNVRDWSGPQGMTAARNVYWGTEPPQGPGM